MKRPALQIRTSLIAPSAGVSKRKTPRTADLTSKLLQTPKNPVQLYLELTDKARKRNFKLDRFFGPNELRPRIDACTIREAFDHGLAGCLSSKRVLSYFFLYLLEVGSDIETFLILGKLHRGISLSAQGRTVRTFQLCLVRRACRSCISPVRHVHSSCRTFVCREHHFSG